MIYDFKKGKTAEYILKKLKAKFSIHSDFDFQRLKGIPHEKVELKEGSYVYQRGEHEYYMFAYKKKFATIEYSTLPRYHITNCVTRDTYSGFRFANEMPVEIYCSDQRRSLGAKHLDLCLNCHEQINFLSYGDGRMEWYKVILKKAENRDYLEEDLRIDGYTMDWNQVSKAYRHVKGFVCEVCGLNLSDRHPRFFCEAHHINKIKTDNSFENLKCLCVKCHSQVDEIHRSNYSTGNGKRKLNLFKIYFNDHERA